MPYKSLKAANPAIRGIDPTVTLAQANLIASWADSIKDRRGDVNPWAVAIALYKRTHYVRKGKWVKDKGVKAHPSLVGELLDLIEGLEALDLNLVRYFPPITELPYCYADDDADALETSSGEETNVGEPAYVIDLFSVLPQVEGKLDFSQPFRILPQGDLYREGHRQVTVEDIDQFADNWQHRATRGVRRKRIVIDAEHETGGIGWYREIFSRGADGLWAKIALSANGKKLLDRRDFYFFSPSVAWNSKDRKTGEKIANQIVGGALTNYPVFGDDTALPTLGYSDAALQRLRDLYQDTDRMATIEHLFQKGEDSMTAEFTTDDRSLLQQIAHAFGALNLRKGGDNVPDDKDKTPTIEVTAEQFAELQGNLATLTQQVETLSQERDTLQQQVTDGNSALAAEAYARVLQEMRQHAETYSHLALPLELADDAPEGSLTAQQHFAWLQAADDTKGKGHWAFFNEVLRMANAGLAEAAQFIELGSGPGAELSDDDRLHQKVYQYSKEHEVDYLTALKAVAGSA